MMNGAQTVNTNRTLHTTYPYVEKPYRLGKYHINLLAEDLGSSEVLRCKIKEFTITASQEVDSMRLIKMTRANNAIRAVKSLRVINIVGYTNVRLDWISHRHKICV